MTEVLHGEDNEAGGRLRHRSGRGVGMTITLNGEFVQIDGLTRLRYRFGPEEEWTQIPHPVMVRWHNGVNWADETHTKFVTDPRRKAMTITHCGRNRRRVYDRFETFVHLELDVE